MAFAWLLFYSFLLLHTYSKWMVAHFPGLLQCGTWHTDTTLTFSFLQQDSPAQLPHPKGFLSQPWASRGAVLICGPLKEECLSKFQGIPEVESEVTVVPLSFLSEIVLLENISTELPFSFSSLRMEKKWYARNSWKN